MSKEITPQADVGALTVRGLTAFAPMLAALSADNVDPVAVIQLEQIGSLFHINGKYAEQVPDLLKRCNSTRLDRLGILIGWRKGDTASYMAHSAGGQAAALLCFCLENLYNGDTCGSILYDLSEKALPAESSLSSINQLAVLSDIASAKLFRLGFGNILAAQVDRILQIYQNLGMPVPADFFDSMTREGTVQLLHAISIALAEETSILRITGTQAIGHIATMAMILFPADMTLVVEGFIIQQGTRRSVIVDSTHQGSNNAPTRVQLEQRIQVTPLEPFPLPIEPLAVPHRCANYTYRWEGHIAEALKLTFISVGLTCSEYLLVACADFVLSLAASINDPDYRSKNSNAPPSGRLVSLLGSNAIHTLSTMLNRLLQVPPIGNPIDVQSAYTQLVAMFEFNLGALSECTCRSIITACDYSTGWVNASARTSQITSPCIARALWRCVGNSVLQALICSFIEADETAVIRFDIDNIDIAKAEQIQNIVNCDEYQGWLWSECEQVYNEVTSVVRSRAYGDVPDLIASTSFVSIFPQAVTKLRVDIDSGFLFSLCEGCIVLKNRYHSVLHSTIGTPRERAEKSLYSRGSSLGPSSSGEHSDLFLTIRELAHSLELRMDLIVEGQMFNLDLTRTIIAAMSLEDAEACDHSPRNQLSSQSAQDIITTSVMAPLATSGKIAVVQTKGNQTAQILACRPGARAILQRNCCLACAIAQARRHLLDQIIVGL